ncbi:MAG: ABC transporter ATP-binding protein, partial [Pseudomonadota bacterium]
GLYACLYSGYGDKLKDYNQALEDVNAASVEFVQGIAVVKTFGQARKAYGRFVDRTREFVDYFWNWMRGLLGISAASEIFMSSLCALIIVLTAGVLLVEGGMAAPVDLLPVLVLAPGLTAPFLMLGFSQNDLELAKEAAGRIRDILDTQPLPEAEAERSPANLRVEYEAVEFSYDGDSPVLNRIDLILEPGTLTALVGPSGSGKSTLARLLPRFWDPAAGRIVIGGVPINEMSSERLYQTVGFVFQDVQLLRATIRENIALGRPDAAIEDIERAARAAQIHDRILTLPRGYDSIAGEDAHLSGGEAQRVSIARALLADAPILVLDEATAFADPESEAAIQDALSTLAAGRTLLVIAHRLHTITGADQICVMNKGRIVERGKHADLLDAGGLYAELWSASEAALGTRSEAAA